MLVCSIKAVNLLPKRTLGNITVKKDPKIASLVPLVGVRCEGSPGVPLVSRLGRIPDRCLFISGGRHLIPHNNKGPLHLLMSEKSVTRSAEKPGLIAKSEKSIGIAFSALTRGIQFTLK